MAEVISTYIPPSFYEAFYLYLYFGSMIFLVYMYLMLCRDGKSKPSEFIIPVKFILFDSRFPPAARYGIPTRVENIDRAFLARARSESVTLSRFDEIGY